MSRKKMPGRFWLLGVPVGVALVASIMVPLALAQNRPASVVAQTTQGLECNERNVDFPLEVNVEEAGPRFKTIAMEKEIFHCGEPVLREVRDVELFIETVEQVIKDPLRVRHIETRAEVATCTKRFASDLNQQGFVPFAVCEADNVPVEEIAPEESSQFADACTLNEQQPADPVEMATTETEGVVKTVNVEKERMSCDFDGAAAAGPFGNSGLPAQFQAEVFLFTEILEAARRVTIDGRTRTSLRPIAKEFIAVICAKDPDTGDVFGCVSFTPEFEQKPV